MKKPPLLLLINPWIYDFAAYDLYSKPYGLLLLASNLKKSGFEIHLLDCMDRNDTYFSNEPVSKDKRNGTGKFYYEEIEKPSILKFVPRRYKRYGLPYHEVEQRIKNFSELNITGICITSIMTYWYPGVFDIIQLVKKYFKNAPIILGGIYAHLLYEHAQLHSQADFIIKDHKIETIIKKIITYLKLPLSQFPISTEEEPLFDNYKKLSYLTLSISQGCPYHCSYCASSLFAPKFMIKNLEKVYQHAMAVIDKFKINHIAFYDDALLYDFEYGLKPFLNLFKHQRMSFHTPNGLHVKFVNEEVAEYLYQYQFKTLRLSLETSNDKRQKKTGAKTTNQEFKKSIIYLNKAGFKQEDLEAYILVGFPGQTKNEIKKTINFVKDNGATPKIVEYSLIPNTEDYYCYFKNKHIDPLLHNNSVFYQIYSKINYNDLQELRLYAKL